MNFVIPGGWYHCNRWGVFVKQIKEGAGVGEYLCFKLPGEIKEEVGAREPINEPRAAPGCFVICVINFGHACEA